MKKISIIIPVYNAMTSGGGYITRAVDSVLNQKNFPIEDVEMLLINDGSKDNSLGVLQKIAQKNPSVIRLIDQENIGVANTRNKAMKFATAEYTTFLDQDDWLDEDFFATLYKKAHDTNADVVASGFRRPDKYGNIVRRFHLSNERYSRYTLSAAWAKLHKTEFLRKNSIKFFDNRYGEDLPFSVSENVLALRYETDDYIGYNWFENKKSVSNTEQKQLTSDGIKSIERLLKRLCDMKPEVGQRDFYYYLLRTTVFYVLFSSRAITRMSFLNANQRFFAILEKKDDVFSRRNIHKLLIPPKGEMKSVGFIVAVFILIEKLRLLPVLSVFWCKKPKTTEK